MIKRNRPQLYYLELLSTRLQLSSALAIILTPPLPFSSAHTHTHMLIIAFAAIIWFTSASTVAFQWIK